MFKKKKTFSWVYTNYKSFISETYKIGLIRLIKLVNKIDLIKFVPD